MKFRAILLGLGLFFAISPVFADDETSYIEHFVTISARADSLNLWPGFQFNAKPYILGIQDETKSIAHLYAFNLQAKNPAWQPLALSSNKPIYYMPQDGIGFSSFEASLQHPYLNVDGQDAIPIELPLEYPIPELYDSIIITDLFMYYELIESPYAKDVEARLESDSQYPYDQFNKPESLALFSLENEILLHYLKTQDQEDLKDYVAVYQHRAKLLDEKALGHEDRMIWARLGYIERKLAHPDLADIYSDMSASLERVTDGGLFGEPELFNWVIEDDLQWFAIPAVEFSLDNLQPGWQQLVESNQAAPSTLLSQHFHLSEDEVKARVQKAMKVYDYDNLLNKIHDLLDPYLKQMKQEQGNYEKQQGIEFLLPMKYASYYYRMGFSINAIQSLRAGVTDLRGCMDQAGTTSISISKIPYLYDDFGMDTDWARFKLSPYTQLKVDGVNMTLDNFMKQKSSLKFHDLELRDKANPTVYVHISAGDAEYIIEAQNERVVIRAADNTLRLKSLSHWVASHFRESGNLQLHRSAGSRFRGNDRRGGKDKNGMKFITNY